MAPNSSTPATSSWSTFLKTVLIPLFTAALLYAIIFIVILPLYRKYKSHIARYSAYAPLDSELGRRTTSLFSPYIIEPSITILQKMKAKIRTTLWRWLVPGVSGMNFPAQDSTFGVRRRESWSDDDEGVEQEEMVPSTESNRRNQTERNEVDIEEGGLFDAETGQSMVGFDVRDATGDGRGFNLGRRRMEDQLSRDERARRFAREMTGQVEPAEIDSQRRLSRELEGAFGDESDEEDQGVVVRSHGR